MPGSPGCHSSLAHQISSFQHSLDTDSVVVDARESIDYNSNEPHFLSYHTKSVYVRVITPLDRATNEPSLPMFL
jgi:hypothetical protein